jgi:hypothetical protein
MPAAKIKAPIKRPTSSLVPLQQLPPWDEQQLPSFFSSDIYPPMLNKQKYNYADAPGPLAQWL